MGRNWRGQWSATWPLAGAHVQCDRNFVAHTTGPKSRMWLTSRGLPTTELGWLSIWTQQGDLVGSSL